MFLAFLTLAAAGGAILTVVWGSMAIIGRGPSRKAARAVVVSLGCYVLALVAFLAGDDEVDAGSRWSNHGAQQITELVIAGAVLAAALGLIALRGDGPRRVVSSIAALATLAAFVGLWLIAVGHSIHLS
jgi:hypothetical protein